jgi:hypothetical protein
MKLKPGVSKITFWVTLVIGLCGVAVTALNMLDGTGTADAAGMLSQAAAFLKSFFLP